MRTRIEIGLAKSFVRRGNDSKRSAGERALRQVGGIAKGKEGGGEDFVGFKKVGQRQDIENSEAAIYCASAIFEGVPSKADTRLKIAKSGIGEEWVAKMRSGVRQISQDGEASVNVGHYRGHFITKAE